MVKSSVMVKDPTGSGDWMACMTLRRNEACQLRAYEMAKSPGRKCCESEELKIEKVRGEPTARMISEPEDARNLPIVKW